MEEHEAGSGCEASERCEDLKGRRESRVSDGTSSTHEVAGGERHSVDRPTVPLPVGGAHPSAGVRLRRPLARLVVKRVLWSLYAVPITVLLLGGYVFSPDTQGPLQILDLVVSLPMFVAMHLYIWDKPTLRPFIWKAYSFVMVAWQATYEVLGRIATGEHFDPRQLADLSIQVPMFTLMFVYAFKDWSVQRGARPMTARCPTCGNEFAGESTCPYCGEVTRRLRPALVSGGLVAAGLALVAAAVAGYGWFSRVVEYVLHPPHVPAKARSLEVYEVREKPPSGVSRAPYWTLLESSGCKRLRTAFERGDWEGLDRSLLALQREFERDPAATEFEVCAAFGQFSRPGDGERLDAWVAHDPAAFPARVARAEYYYAQAFEARGDDWAQETSDEQFAAMDEWLDKALGDVAVAIKREPEALNAHVVHVYAHNAHGQERQEDGAFEEGRKHCPECYLTYSSAMHGKRPRWGGSYPEMEHIARRALDANGHAVRLYALYGFVYEDQASLCSLSGRHGQAITLYSKALEYGERAWLLRRRAGAYCATKGYERALSDLDRALTLEPEYVSALLLRAELYVRKGDTTRALADVHAAEDVSPGDEAIKEWKSWALREYGVEYR